MNKLLILSICFLASCTVRTDVYTTPEKAQVYLDGEYIGESPCSVYYNYMRQSVDLDIIKKNHQPKKVTIHKRVYVHYNTPSYQFANPDSPPYTIRGEWPEEVSIPLREDLNEAQPDIDDSY